MRLDLSTYKIKSKHNKFNFSNSNLLLIIVLLVWYIPKRNQRLQEIGGFKEILLFLFPGLVWRDT